MDTESSWQQYQTIHFTIRTLIRFNSPVFQMHDFVYVRTITFHCSSTQLQTVRSCKTDCFPVRFEHIEQHTQCRAYTSTRSAHSCRILLTHRKTVISYLTQTHYLCGNGSFSAFRKDFSFILGTLDAHRSGLPRSRNFRLGGRFSWVGGRFSMCTKFRDMQGAAMSSKEQ